MEIGLNEIHHQNVKKDRQNCKMLSPRSQIFLSFWVKIPKHFNIFECFGWYFCFNFKKLWWLIWINGYIFDNWVSYPGFDFWTDSDRFLNAKIKSQILQYFEIWTQTNLAPILLWKYLNDFKQICHHKLQLYPYLLVVELNDMKLMQV